MSVAADREEAAVSRPFRTLASGVRPGRGSGIPGGARAVPLRAAAIDCSRSSALPLFIFGRRWYDDSGSTRFAGLALLTLFAFGAFRPGRALPTWCGLWTRWALGARNRDYLLGWRGSRILLRARHRHGLDDGVLSLLTCAQNQRHQNCRQYNRISHDDSSRGREWYPFSCGRTRSQGAPPRRPCTNR